MMDCSLDLRMQLGFNENLHEHKSCADGAFTGQSPCTSCPRVVTLVAVWHTCGNFVTFSCTMPCWWGTYFSISVPHTALPESWTEFQTWWSPQTIVYDCASLAYVVVDVVQQRRWCRNGSVVEQCCRIVEPADFYIPVFRK